jgi:hypothetical protein
MSNFISDLQANSPAAAKAAAALGISMDDLANKTQVERMRIFLDALNGIQDPATRSALAVDVFKKAGRDIVPLAKDFGGAMAEARGELGSLPRILDENAASLDDLGDKLTNAVGSKLTELAVGLTAGATGAKDLASALANIDAAGFGEKLGNSIRAAFAAPQEYAMAIGEFLLAGVLKAANALDAAMKHAVNVYYEMMQNPGFWIGFFGYIEAGFAKVGAVFTSAIAEGIKSVLSVMDWNPLWKPFTGLAKEALDGITAGINDAGIAATNQMEQGATQMQAAWNNATASSKYIYEDTFGAEQHLQKAAEHMAKAHEAAATMKDSSAAVAENFGKGSKAISDALNNVRGFDLGGAASDPFKLGYGGSSNFPTSAGTGTAQDATAGKSVFGGGSSSAPKTFNERVAELRGQAAQSRSDQRASELIARGAFNSAVAEQDRGQRAFDRAMTQGRIKDLLGGKNFGEAYRDYQSETRMGDRMTRSEFEKSIREAAMTESERAEQKTKSRGGQGDSAKGSSQTPATEATLKLILNKIKERPILVA